MSVVFVVCVWGGGGEGEWGGEWGYTDHTVSLGTCPYQNYEHNYVMNMNYFEPIFYLTVRLIMHSGDESAGICCSSQWWL